MLYSRCTPEQVYFLFAIESVLPVYDHHQFWSNITGQWSLVFDFNGLAKEGEVILKKYDTHIHDKMTFTHRVGGSQLYSTFP